MHMIKNRMLCGAAAAALLLSGACASEESTPRNEAAKRHLDAWMSVNHPGIGPTGLGIYILDDQPGTGETLQDADAFLFAEYTFRDLDGNISSTTLEKLARQLGTYQQSNCYGPSVLVNSKAYTQAGLLEMFKGMKVGGTRTAVIPGWLNVTEDYDTAQEYLDKCTGSNAVCTVTLTGKTDDIVKWEVDTLEKYTARYMNDVDSTFYGWYYQQLKAPKDTVTLPRDTSFYINYTGRLLNGQVFDTTVEDTAKVYGLYASSKTYQPVYITLNEDYTRITMAQSSSSSGSTVQNGFSYCLSKMKRYEKGRCAFYSRLGYGYSGSGSKIPRFAPLVFDIELVDKPE